jgi:cation diffusion facilitator family transporter
MSLSVAMRATLVGMGANILLLAVKAAASGLSDSLTIFSETLNSLADTVSAVVILVCVRWAWKSPDATHPFGHRRAEPIAGLLVAIFTGILGFEVCRSAIMSLLASRTPERIGAFPIAALWFTAVLKTGLAAYFQHWARRLHSPAFRATAADCRNDVLIALQGLAGIVIAKYELPVVDAVSALVVGAYILYTGHRIGLENIDYLMGRAPDAHLLGCIRQAAAGVPSVQEVDEVRGHYVGTFIHVELTVRVEGSLSTTMSHDVSEAVRAAVESDPAVDRAFVHIEPVAR